MDKLNKYLHRLISHNKGEVIYSQRSTYYHISGRVIRVSDHIGRNSDGSISIIYDASGSDRYIVHAHCSGMISIVDYESLKKLIKSFVILPAIIGILSGANNVNNVIAKKMANSNTVLGYNINEFSKGQRNAISEFIKQMKQKKSKKK